MVVSFPSASMESEGPGGPGTLAVSVFCGCGGLPCVFSSGVSGRPSAELLDDGTLVTVELAVDATDPLSLNTPDTAVPDDDTVLLLAPGATELERFGTFRFAPGDDSELLEESLLPPEAAGMAPLGAGGSVGRSDAGTDAAVVPCC